MAPLVICGGKKISTGDQLWGNIGSITVHVCVRVLYIPNTIVLHATCTVYSTHNMAHTGYIKCTHIQHVTRHTPDDPLPITLLQAPGEFSNPLVSSDKYPGGGLSTQQHCHDVNTT